MNEVIKADNDKAIKMYASRCHAFFSELTFDGYVVLHRAEGEPIELGCPPNMLAEPELARDFRLFTIAVAVLLGNVIGYSFIQKRIVADQTSDEFQQRYGKLTPDMLQTALRRDYPLPHECPYLVPLLQSTTMQGDTVFATAYLSREKQVDRLCPIGEQLWPATDGLKTDLGGYFDVPMATAQAVLTLLATKPRWQQGDLQAGMAELEVTLLDYCNTETATPMFADMLHGFVEGVVEEGMLLTLPCLTLDYSQFSGHKH